MPEWNLLFYFISCIILTIETEAIIRHALTESSENSERFEGSKRCSDYNLSVADLGLRIAGGELASRNMFPYQVGLLLYRPPSAILQCGGALISANYVLTAAHCIHRVVLGRVYLGALIFANETDAADVHNLSYADFLPHPNYRPPYELDDIGLIYLKRPAVLSARVLPIALAKSFMIQERLENETVITSGWGLTSEQQNDIPAVFRRPTTNMQLYYVEAPVLPIVQCSCYYLPGLVRGRYHLCIDGTGGRGSCEGDSGGPLTWHYQNSTYLVGITSFGSAGGCTIGFPSVYTRITNYLNWIKYHTGIASNVD